MKSFNISKNKLKFTKSVHNNDSIQVVYDDELRTIMRDYNISAEEIKQMLELYAQGGEIYEARK